MGHTKLVNTAMAAAITLALHGTAIAQEQNEAGMVEEVIVTGIKRSLMESADIKRDASGVVDAISAEDIGKFPDTNLAESLQRITGVSIDRVNNEGNQVTVRGFGPSFNLVTLDGRQMPNSSALSSAGISRSFNFREIASESVRAVEVYKTGRADISSGGIGATINIVTGKPFDYDGFVAAANVAAVFDTSVINGDEVTPEFSGMISNTFADDTFGILASYSYSKRDFGVERIGTQNYWNPGYPGQANPDTSAIDTSKNPDLTTWRTVTVDDDRADYSRTRQNAQLVLQWAPTDSLTVSANYFGGRFEESGNMNRMSFWFDNVQEGAADVNGTIINPSRMNDELNFWGWEYQFDTENDSYGLNVDWQVTDSLSLVLDGHSSTSHANKGNLPAEIVTNLKNPFGAAAPVHIGADFSGKIPSVSYDDSGLPGGAYALENIEADLYQERGNEIENTIEQLRLSGRWDSESDWFTGLSFGVENTNYDVTVDNIYGASFALGNGAMDISGLDLDFIPGKLGFEYAPVFSAQQFLDLVDSQGLKNPTNVGQDGVEEDTWSYYLSADIDTFVGNNMRFRMNIGVRYEETEVTSYSVVDPVVGFNWITPLEMSKIYYGQTIEDNLEGKYDHWLPNLDMSLEMRDGLIGRFSYSETVARSNIGSMFPRTSLNNHYSTGPYLGSQGNPNLLPFKSDNFDLSLEWYYSEGSYASVGYFHKKVDNFIGTDVEQRIIESPNGPLTNPSANPRGDCPSGTVAVPNPDCVSQPGDPVITWDITTPLNRSDTAVYGWEFNIQHMFGESGFGAIFNYTIVDTDDKFDVYSSDNEYNVAGLSDSANLVAFYEKGDWAARIAYNWRDKFILGSTNGEPKFVAEYGQLDLSASWTFNDWGNLYVEAINLTDEKTHRYGRWVNQIYDYESYGPRYTIGLRGRW